MNQRLPLTAAIALLAATAIALFAASLAVGSYALTPGQVFDALAGHEGSL